MTFTDADVNTAKNIFLHYHKRHCLSEVCRTRAERHTAELTGPREKTLIQLMPAGLPNTTDKAFSDLPPIDSSFGSTIAEDLSTNW